MRSLLLVMLVACGGGDAVSVHEAGGCDSSWSGTGYTLCERACETMPYNYATVEYDMPCGATHADIAPDITYECSATFEFDGHRGCCAPHTSTTPVRFYECI